MARARRSRSKNDENDNGNGKKKKGSSFGKFLKWGAAMAGGAVVGAIAVDKYRSFKNDKEASPQMNPANQAMHALFGGNPNPFGSHVHVTNFSGGPGQAPGFMMMPEPPTPPTAPEPPAYDPPEPDTRPDPADIEWED